MADKFVHLHTHSDYSMLDGLGTIESYFEKAAQDGMPALAITDHGNMYAVPDAFKASKKTGVLYIPGDEIYCEPEMGGFTREEVYKRNKGGKGNEGDESATGKKYFHQTTFCYNQTGLQNLYKLATDCALLNYKYQPMASLEMLEKYSEGIFATTSCLGGVILQHLMRGERDKAEAHLSIMIDIYGRDNVLVELQRHGIEEQDKTNPILLEMAKKFNLRAIATNDCHYTNCSDHDAHDALIAMQTGSKLADTERFRFSGHPGANDFKLSAEMRNAFSDMPELCDNTLWVAERIEPMEFSTGGYHMPHFQIPDKYGSEAEYLRALVYGGALKRYGTLSEEVQARIEYELKIITDMGFPGYFLILWDICRFCRESNIRTGPGRGSAAGSIIAYCLAITRVDPIEYDLLFERFLNPSRISMPDIDLDIENRGRQTVINYTIEKYGRDFVAQIITFSEIKARSAIESAARILDLPIELGKEIKAKIPPPIAGKEAPLSQYITDKPDAKWAKFHPGGEELRKYYHSATEDGKNVIDIAKSVEGAKKNTGVHASAVVISDKPLVEYLPRQYAKDKDDKNAKAVEKVVVTQFSGEDVGYLGLVKMDYLGLVNLDILSDAVEFVREIFDVDLDVDQIPLDDAKTYEILSRGYTAGVFQVENSGMASLLQQVGPTSIHDIAAVISLYRPGPMGMEMHLEYAKRKNGKSKVQYLHEDAEEILSETLGILTYQESVMRIAQKFASYSLPEADNLRKAMGKKLDTEMNMHKEKFKKGCVENGYTESLAHQWWSMIEPFADYGFNKSHAYSYAFIAYQTAYIKANYPAAFFAAVFNHSNIEKIGVYINDAKKFDVQVQPPDINLSQSKFAPLNEAVILTGLEAIRGVGEAPAELILQERAKGAFVDFVDFAKRARGRAKNIAVVKALVSAGAFDSLHSRGGLLQQHATILEGGKKAQKFNDAGIQPLVSFDLEDKKEANLNYIPDIKIDRSVVFDLEQEFLGAYISDHPLNGFESAIEQRSTHSIDNIIDIVSIRKDPIESASQGLDKAIPMTIAGLVRNVIAKRSRKGSDYVILELEDFTGRTEMLGFGKCVSNVKAITKGSIVAVSGTLLAGNDSDKVFIDNVATIETTKQRSRDELTEYLSRYAIIQLAESASDQELQSLKSLLETMRGECTIVLELNGADRKRLKLPREEWSYDPTIFHRKKLEDLPFVNRVIIKNDY